MGVMKIIRQACNLILELVDLNCIDNSIAITGLEIKPNLPLAWGMSSPEKLLVPRKNH